MSVLQERLTTYLDAAHHEMENISKATDDLTGGPLYFNSRALQRLEEATLAFLSYAKIANELYLVLHAEQKGATDK